jgi:hypothetical protein
MQSNAVKPVSSMISNRARIVLAKYIQRDSQKRTTNLLLISVVRGEIPSADMIYFLQLVSYLS